MYEQLLDRIYEASVIPELWVDVLDSIAPIVDCEDGLLFAMDSRGQVRFISSARSSDEPRHPQTTENDRLVYIRLRRERDRRSKLRRPGTGAIGGLRSQVDSSSMRSHNACSSCCEMP
jgi:hypothetical protein